MKSGMSFCDVPQILVNLVALKGCVVRIGSKTPIAHGAHSTSHDSVGYSPLLPLQYCLPVKPRLGLQALWPENLR